MTGATTIDASLLGDLAETIAHRVAELLTPDQTPTAPLIDAAEVARRYGIARSTVYDNAARLGAIRLGDGTRARLRFDPATVAAALTAQAPIGGTPNVQPPRRERQRRTDRTPSGAPLLAVKDRT